MNTIIILPEQGEDHLTTFSASIAERKATGHTVGQALDALTSQLSAEESAAPVIVQQFRPDHLFSAAQHDRLATLMARWRAARETRTTLLALEQTELERLVDEEVQSATARAAQILRDLEPTQQLRRKHEETSELRRRREQERRRAAQHHVASMAAYGLMLLILVAYIIIHTGSLSDIPNITFLITYSVTSAMHLLFSLGEEAAHKRADKLYLQAEESSRLGQLLDLSESLESSADSGKYREQPKAQ